MKFTKKQVPIAIALSGLLVAAAAAPRLMASQRDSDRRTDRITDLSRDLQQSEAEEQLVDGRRVIAEKRYQDGCAFVTLDATYVALPGGVPLLHPVTNLPLLENTVVCDYMGNTALVGADGSIVLETVAYVGDPEVVAASRDRAESSGNFAYVGDLNDV
jgi:hypothetical protein